MIKNKFQNIAFYRNAYMVSEREEKADMNTLQKKIFRRLLEQLTDDKSVPGDRLPTETVLAEKFSTHRANASCAIRPLEEAGLVFRNKKGGTVIARKPNLLEKGRLIQLLSMKLTVLNYSRRESVHIHWNDRIRTPFKRILDRNGIEVEEVMAGDDPESFGTARISSLIAGGMNSMLLVPGGDEVEHLFADAEDFYRFSDRIFLFDRSGSCRNISFCNIVGINNFVDGVRAGELAVSRGAALVVFCHTRGITEWRNERCNGIRKGLQRLGGEAVPMEHFIHGVHGTFPVLNSPGKIVLIAENDALAVSLIEAGRRRGSGPGPDYGLISFDGDIRYKKYELTTFSPDLDTIGTRLGEAVVSVMCHRAANITSTQLVASSLLRGKTL